jgi:hypothetical protein
MFSISNFVTLQTFCALFTSPTSSESFEAETEEGPSRKKHKTDNQKKATKTDVATLLRMEGKVTARSIAYAATLVNSPPLSLSLRSLPWHSWYSILRTRPSGWRSITASTLKRFTTSL